MKTEDIKLNVDYEFTEDYLMEYGKVDVDYCGAGLKNVFVRQGTEKFREGKQIRIFHGFKTKESTIISIAGYLSKFIVSGEIPLREVREK